MYKICRTEKSQTRQRELENGFLNYMETVPFFEMEIADLCRYLDIPRKTFYRYFGSREDALFALVDHRLVDMSRYIARQSENKPVSLRQDAVAFFSFWKQERRFLDILNRNMLNGVLMNRSVSQVTANLSLTNYSSGDPNAAESYAVTFMISGIMSTMFQWYSSGFQKSEKELADILVKLCPEPISTVLNYSG